MFAVLFSALFLLIAIPVMLFGFFRGRKFVWRYSVSRLVLVIGSAVAAMLLSALLSFGIAALLFALTKELLFGIPTVGDLLASLPTADDAVRGIIAMPFASLLFIVFFSVFKRAFAFLGRMLCRRWMAHSYSHSVKRAQKKGEPIPEKYQPVYEEVGAYAEGKKPSRKDRKAMRRNKIYGEFRTAAPTLAGGFCGLLCSLFVFLMILVPAAGTVHVANSAAAFTKHVDQPILQTVGAVLDGADRNLGSFTVRLAGGDLLYSGITAVPVGGKLTSLNQEAKVIGDAEEAVFCLMDQEETNEQRARALRAFGKRFSKADMIPMLTSDLISAASESWGQGGAYLGIARPKMNLYVNDFAESCLDLLADGGYDTVGEDVRTVSEVAALVIENGGVEGLRTTDAILSTFQNEEMLSEVFLALFENEHLAPLANEISEAGFKAVGRALKMPDDTEDLYDSFIGEIASVWDENLAVTHFARLARLTDSIFETYDSFGIYATRHESELVAMGMLETFGNDEVTEEELRAYFAFDEKGTYLATDLLYRMAKEAANGRKALTNALCEHYLPFCANADEAAERAKACADLLIKSIRANTLSFSHLKRVTAERMRDESVLVALDALSLDTETPTDAEAEARRLGHVFAMMVGFADEMKGEKREVGELMRSFGPVFDALCECQTIGEEKTGTLLVGVLQSEKVRGKVGFTLYEATDIALDINKGATGNANYTLMLKSLGDTMEVVRIASENGDSADAVRELLNDLTPESASTLQKISTPETMKKNGVPEKNAPAVSGMVSNLFGNLSDAKEEGNMTDEEYDKEARAVSSVMNVAMSASKSTAQNTFGEGSKTGLTADEFVARITDSSATSKTVIETVYTEDGMVENPLGAKPISEDEQNQLVSALDKQWKEQLASGADAKATERKQQELYSIAQLFGITVTFEGNSLSKLPAVQG